MPYSVTIITSGLFSNINLHKIMKKSPQPSIIPLADLPQIVREAISQQGEGSKGVELIARASHHDDGSSLRAVARLHGIELDGNVVSLHTTDTGNIVIYNNGETGHRSVYRLIE